MFCTLKTRVYIVSTLYLGNEIYPSSVTYLTWGEYASTVPDAAHVVLTNNRMSISHPKFDVPWVAR